MRMGATEYKSKMDSQEKRAFLRKPRIWNFCCAFRRQKNVSIFAEIEFIKADKNGWGGGRDVNIHWIIHEIDISIFKFTVFEYV